MRYLLTALLVLAMIGCAAASITVYMYADPAPNAYGSPNFAAWRTAAYADAANGSFVNMRNGTFVGQMKFTATEAIVYSTGDLGKRLHWVYWIPGQTVAGLQNLFQVKNVCDWDGVDYSGGSTPDGPEVGWVQPSSWIDYGGGVVGTLGNAWWATDDLAEPLSTDASTTNETDAADIQALADEMNAYQTHWTGSIRYRESVNDPWTVQTMRMALVQPNTVRLDPTAPSLYIKPDEICVFNLNVANLLQPVTGLQAMMNFSSTYFKSGTGEVVVAAGGGDWDQLIWDQWTTGGDLDVAVGVRLDLAGGTDADATTAVITLQANGVEGATKMVFRPDADPDPGLTQSTYLSDTSSSPVWPAKVDSVDVVIDGTAPDIALPADYSTSVATQSIAASASDPVSGGVASGIASFKMDGSDFTSPTTVVLVPGVNTFDFEAIDNAGNVATKTLTITYTQPAPTIGLYASLAPNVYAGGSSWNAWKANAFTFLLTGVQNGTTPYNTFQDLGFATELDYSTTIVTTGSSTWLGLPCLDSTEWGTAVQFAYVIDNGVVSNPGAAKLDLNYVAGTYRFEFASGEIDFDSYASLAGKTFGGNVSWKGYDYSGGTWVEVTSGSKADMIISVKNRIGNACGPLQSDMDALYAELSGATGDEFLSGKYGITYSGQPGVGDASTGVQTLNFGPVNDDTNPLVAITSPSDGLETNVAALTVTGTASDPGDLASSLKSVTVNGVPVTVTDGAWSIDLTLVEGNNTITVVAEDYAGNTASDTITVLLDTVPPTISINDNFAADPVLQGVYTVTVTASDASSGVAGPPTMNWDGLSASAGTEGPAGTWTYTVTIDDATANGPHTITADISDEAGNPATQATRTISVNKNQATGQVELEGFVGASRDVTFVATGATTKSWTLTLSFSGGVASYTLTDVPDGVTGLSAKTNWSLRNKLAVTPDGDGQISAIFTGAEKLLGGDINGSNSINILDYSILKIQWMTTNPVADIDGSGVANAVDYNIMKRNWFEVGGLQ